MGLKILVLGVGCLWAVRSHSSDMRLIFGPVWVCGSEGERLELEVIPCVSLSTNPSMECFNVTGGGEAIFGLHRDGKVQSTSGGLRGTKECKSSSFPMD